MKYQPSHAYIIVTENCNLKCPHCFVNQKNNIISIDFVQQILIKYPSINLVTLFGGQPLLQSNNKINNQIINLCKSKNIEISITSNFAFTLSAKQLNILSNLDYISTSWNYHRFSIEQFEIWKSNLEYLKYLNRFITCLITLTEDLILNLTPIDAYQLFQTFSVDAIKFQPFIGVKKISNKLIDKWLEEFYSLNIDTNKYVFFKYIQESFLTNQPSNIFNRNCSKYIITLHPDKILTLCPNHFLIPDQVDKLQNLNKNYQYNCLLCEFKHICSGSCILLAKQEKYCNGYPLLFKKIQQKIIS